MSEREVAVEAEVRVTYPTEPGRLAGILKVLRRRGGRLRAHLVYRLYDTSVGFSGRHPGSGQIAGYFLRPEAALLRCRQRGDQNPRRAT